METVCSRAYRVSTKKMTVRIIKDKSTSLKNILNVSIVKEVTAYFKVMIT